MLNKKVIQLNAILFGVLGLLSLVFGLAGLGAMAIIFSAVNLLVALIYFIVKENETAKSCLLVGGCLLLLGFTLCSTFPLRFN